MRPCVLRIKQNGADYRMVIADNEVDSSCRCSPIRYNFLSKHKDLAQNSQLFPSSFLAMYVVSMAT